MTWFSSVKPIGQAHFQGALDFLDLFLRTDISSASRARAFLWLCFNYLEAPSVEDDYDGDFTPNPFSEAAQSSGMPSLVYLSPEESASENQETVEDKFTSDKLLAQRIKIVTNQTAKELSKATNKDSANVSLAGDDESDEHKPKPKKGAKLAIKDRKAMVPTISIKPSLRTTSDPMSHLADLDDGSDSDQLMDEFMRRMSVDHTALLKADPLPQERHLSRSKSFEFPTNGLALRQNGIGRRFAPYEIKEHDRTRHRSRRLSQPRTMLQRWFHSDFADTPQTHTVPTEAWHAVNSTDALLDSDEEEGDEYMREDYSQSPELMFVRSLIAIPQSNVSESSTDLQNNPGSRTRLILWIWLSNNEQMTAQSWTFIFLFFCYLYSPSSQSPIYSSLSIHTPTYSQPSSVPIATRLRPIIYILLLLLSGRCITVLSNFPVCLSRSLPPLHINSTYCLSLPTCLHNPNTVPSLLAFALPYFPSLRFPTPLQVSSNSHVVIVSTLAVECICAAIMVQIRFFLYYLTTINTSPCDV